MNPRLLFLSTRVSKLSSVAAALACAVLLVPEVEAEMVRLPIGSKWSTSLSKNVPVEAIRKPAAAADGDIFWFHLVRDRGQDNNFRVELNGQEPELTRNIHYGTQYKVRFLLHTPPEWQADSEHEIIWQLHRVPDPKERGKRSQPLASLRIIDNRFFLHLCYSQAPVSFAKNHMECLASAQFGQLTPNRAYAFELDYRLSRGTLEQGRLVATLDGRQVYAYEGPMGYDDQVGPYMKFGIYKAVWNPIHDRLTSTDERRYGFSGVSVVRTDHPTDPKTSSTEAALEDAQGPWVSFDPPALPRRQLSAAQPVHVAPAEVKPLREQTGETRQSERVAAVLRKRNRTHGGASGALHRAIQQWQKMERWSD